MNIFFKKYLYINLSDKTYEKVSIDEEILGNYGGGKGLGTYLLYNLNPVGVDPFDSDNHIIINTGPADDLKVWGSSRFGIYTKSPLTNCYLDSTSGGHLSKYISRTGYDAIVIKGKSQSPVWLEITDENIEFHDASDLWGKDTYISEDTLKSKAGSDKCGAIVIGPAGENLCKFSLIENDYWRSLGRGGAGAVMGSKKIKGIVFHGNQRRQAGNQEKIDKLYSYYRQKSKTDETVLKYRKYGTPAGVKLLNEKGAFPTKYWHKGVFEKNENITAEKMQEVLDVKPKACEKCFIACGKLSKTKEGSKYPGLVVEGPEYETIYALGGLCCIDDIEDILYLNDLCDRYGIDTITAGNIIAFTMEASSLGKTKEKYEYGNTSHAADLIEKIVFKKGIGKVLSEGIVFASKYFGLGDLAIHNKGLEPAGYDPRMLPGTALGYAVSMRGGCHLRSGFYKAELSDYSKPDDIDDKAYHVADWEDRFCVQDTLIICRFFRDLYWWDETVELFRVIYGDESISKDELKNMSNRIHALAKKFNIRENPDNVESLDKLPKRLFKEKLENGSVMDQNVFDKLKSEYYKLRGWDERGIPVDNL